MNESISEEQWMDVDAHIVGHRIFPALKVIRTASGVGIKDAIGLLIDRYRQLRQTRPDDFPCSDEDYWEGFYS